MEPYPVTPELTRDLERFNLSAGWFVRDKLPPPPEYYLVSCATNRMPYLLFAPKASRRPVPLLLYFGGLGEFGTDLALQFHQQTVFAKVTSPAFQARHPCYLLAPMPPKNSGIRHWPPDSPNGLADLISDTMYAVIRAARSPAVDTNRLYTTGLSYGGLIAFEMVNSYAGRFAAGLPVSTYEAPEFIPSNHIVNFWLLLNNNEFVTDHSRMRLALFERTVRERGGDFRLSRFADTGHNAWDAAWREDVVWDWLFSKTADGSPVRDANARRRTATGSLRADLEGAKCSASVEGRDEKTMPDRAADGLDGTCYVSKEPVGRGGWWQVEFVAPVSGPITVFSGTRDGRDRLSRGHAEVSANGKSWSRAGSFSKTTGTCAFRQRTPVRFLRVVSEASRPETLTLREVSIERPAP